MDDRAVNALRELDFNSLGEAPEGAGIYAWYGQLIIGDADLISSGTADGADEDRRRFRRLLQQHSTRYSALPLETRAVASFGERFEGQLMSNLATLVHEQLADDPGADEAREERPEAVLDPAISSPKMRKAFSQALAASIPWFSAPIYIGMSDNLRRRLLEHRRQMVEWHGAVSRDPDGRERLRRSSARGKSTFARRAVMLNFAPDQLRVCYLDLAEFLEGDLSAKQTEEIARATEWFLNRWHRPIAGRL